MNLTTCLRKYSPNVFRQVDPYTDPIYLQSPHRPQATLSQTLILPRSHSSHNSPHIYTDCQSCEDDPRTGAHICRTCIEAQYYALQAQSPCSSQAQIPELYINCTPCECPYCESGLSSPSSSPLTSRAYIGTGGRYSNLNIESLSNQIHNTGRNPHIPSNRLARNPCREMGLLSPASCLSALGSLSALGVSSLGGLGGLGGIGGVRDMRDMREVREVRNYGGRYGLQNNRLGYRL